MAFIQLSIADPCHENWNNMLSEDKGRFCLSCQKKVVDFTHMSDAQIFDYFKKYTGSTCGQFTPAQLNRNITKPKTYSISRWKYFWQILLPAVFTFYKLEAQTLKGRVASKVVCKADPSKPVLLRMGRVKQPTAYKELMYNLEGTLVDEKGSPLPYATIASQNGKYAIADSAGHFSIELPPSTSLTISSIGYESHTFSYDSLQTSIIKSVEVKSVTNTVAIKVTIQLQKAVISSQNAVVTGYENGTLIGRLGGVTVVRSRSFYPKPKLEKLIDNLPQLKIFPNPIQLGQNFQLTLQVRKPGVYQLLIKDAAGKALLEKKLNVTSENQMETIEGEKLQQKGIYFISLLYPGDKKDKGITGKIVVQ